jgi:hypothetical protein
VVTLWLSHQELAVERNVDVCEELLQGRAGVQEQQPDGSRCFWFYNRLKENVWCFVFGIKYRII